jgi:hypothetical protein
LKKALQGQKQVFLQSTHGRLDVALGFKMDKKMLKFINGELDRPEGVEFTRDLRMWIKTYVTQGITEEMIGLLDVLLKEIRYTKQVIPLQFLPSETGLPRIEYVANYDHSVSQEVRAADEFTKLFASGALARLKICKECGRLFTGPPQAKWCSKTCGSKFRVRHKRRRDAQ